MEDLKNGLLQINLSDEIIDQLYQIIFGIPDPIEDPDATYDYIFSDYHFFENYKASYIIYKNSIGLFSVASANEKSAKVITYINNLLTQLTTQPEFWQKLADGIRKEKYTFAPKLITSVSTDADGRITSMLIRQDPKQDYRVYTIDAINTSTGKPVFNNKEVSNVTNTRVSSTQYKTPLVGYLDPSVFGGNGYYKTIVYNDVQVDSTGNLVDKIKVKTVKPGRNEYKRLLNQNGYYFKSDLKLLLEPDFLSKTFQGGLYVNVKNLFYKL
ncbi:hypothetical protein IQ231_22640, partial [Cuspidothrix issatschenkoi LEGE 03284]|uniref:hypothetical protein n=1 Tax=Cuspidothrix issatschenkoi TaxID=230752 RepID=UPI00187ECF40